jgi:hypothetical protein
MASNKFVYVYYNGQVLRNSYGIFFQSEETQTFKVSRRSSLVELKDRIEKKHHSGMEVSDIIYRNPIFFGNGTMQFEPLKILDDDDVEAMFDIHSQFKDMGSIELCVNLNERQPSLNILPVNLESTISFTRNTNTS